MRGIKRIIPSKFYSNRKIVYTKTNIHNINHNISTTTKELKDSFKKAEYGQEPRRKRIFKVLKKADLPILLGIIGTLTPFPGACVVGYGLGMIIKKVKIIKF